MELILNGKVLHYISFKIKDGDYITPYLFIEVDYYVNDAEDKKIRFTKDLALRTTQGFYIEKYIDNKVYLVEAIKK